MANLSESQKKVIKDYFNKKYNLKEGIIDYIFGRVLVNKLKNDKNFVKAAQELDKRLAITKQLLQTRVDKGEPIPDEIWKIMTGKKDN